jgi:hypothetical protein
MTIEEGLEDDSSRNRIQVTFTAALPVGGPLPAGRRSWPGRPPLWADEAALRLRGGQTFIPGVDRDVKTGGEGVGEGLGLLGLGAHGAAEGEGKANDDGLGVLIFGEPGHGLDGVGTGVDCGDGHSDARAEVAGGDADAFLAGVYAEDATAGGRFDIRRRRTRFS